MAIIFVFWYTVTALQASGIDSIVLKDGSLERHRPALRLALIIPFTHNEVMRVLSNLEGSWTQHPPCDPTRQYSKLIDLVFYHHRNILTELDGHLIKQLQTKIDKSPVLRTCFGSVRFLNALLKDEEDVYPIGASKMFFRLFRGLAAHPLLHEGGGGSGGRNSMVDIMKHHQAFYYMEPDNVPCRRNWLDRLYEEASVPGDFWMRGSIMRDGNPVVGDWTFSDHINGNALYRADDPLFVEFVLRVEREMEADAKGDMYLQSYDIALDLVRRNRTLVDWVEYTTTASKFQYTETIQNWYRTKVNATALCTKYPATYLVHGREVHS